jgi:hypothetical protein
VARIPRAGVVSARKDIGPPDRTALTIPGPGSNLAASMKIEDCGGPMTVSVKDAVLDRWRDANTRWEAEGRRRGGLVSWNHLVEPIAKSLVEQGIDESWIQVGHHAMLPGAYGLGSSWDLRGRFVEA